MILLVALLLHENGVSSSRIDFNGREAQVTFTLSLEELAGLARLDLDRNGTVEPAEWAAVLPVLLPYLAGHFLIDNDGEDCPGTGEPGRLPPALSLSDPRAPVTIALRYRSAKPMERVTIRCSLFREHGGNPRHIAELPQGRTIVFDRDRTQAEVVPAPSRAGLTLPLGSLALLAAAVALRVRCARGCAA